MQNVVGADGVEGVDHDHVGRLDHAVVFLAAHAALFGALKALIDAQAAAFADDPLRQNGQVARDDVESVAQGVGIFAQVRHDGFVPAAALKRFGGEYVARTHNVERRKEIIERIALIAHDGVDGGAAFHRLFKEGIVLGERFHVAPVGCAADGCAQGIAQFVGHDFNEVDARFTVVIHMRLHAGIALGLLALKMKPESHRNAIGFLVVQHRHQAFLFVHVPFVPFLKSCMRGGMENGAPLSMPHVHGQGICA